MLDPPSAYHAIAVLSVVVVIASAVAMLLRPALVPLLVPVAAGAVGALVLAWTAGLLLRPEAFVAPERAKAPDSVAEARLLGCYLLGGELLLALTVWRRWRRSLRSEDEEPMGRP